MELEEIVVELEETVRLLSTVAETTHRMLGNMNEVSRMHTALIAGLLKRLEGANSEGLLPGLSHDVGNT